jgi:excisionase family DNA binding protein
MNRSAVAGRQEQPLLIRVEEAATLLGVGRSTVYEKIAANELPGVVRLGRSVRVSREALESWVREQAGSPRFDYHREDSSAA